LPNIASTLAASPACDEWRLVQQAIAGDSNVLDHLFTIHTSRLHRTAFAVLRNKEDAEDAVQNGFRSAYAKLQSFQGKSSFSTWLTRIVVNSALMIRRRRNSRPEPSLDEMLDDQREGLQRRIIDAGPNPEEICAATEIRELLEKQIRQLSPGLQAAIQHCDLKDLSTADSTKKLGIRDGKPDREFA
jgi:RNA polymerase sigma-70 factor, ECF subfamily